MKEKAKKKGPKPKAKQQKSVYTCTYCRKQFDNSSNWSSHIKLHSTEEPYHCDLCDYKCKVKKYLTRHVKKTHTKPTGHKCDVCGKCFHFECALRNHVRVHTGERPYKCDECDKAFSSLFTLRGHKLIHTGEKPYQCQYCDYACRDNSTIRKHMERHLGISKDYPCSVCNKNFKTKQTLEIHVDEVHLELDTRRIPCELCDKLFKTKGSLRLHVKTVHSESNRVKCEICGRTSTKNNLQAHMRRHIDVKPYKCSYKPCGKRFTDRGDLKRHVTIHFPENQHICTVCNRRFSRKFRLTRHMRNGCRRAQCHHCGQLFSTKFFVAQHIKNAHGPYPKSREYLCDVCDMVTYNRRCIIQHLKYGHGTEKDTKCQICKKDYFNCLTLKEHYLSHHNLIYCLLDQKKASIVDIKVEPLEDEVMADPQEFIYEVDIQKQEINDTSQDDTSLPLKPTSPQHFSVDSDTITYSKKVLSEDISRSLLQQDALDEFDKMFLGHVLKKPELVEPPKQIVDEKKKECVEKRLDELLAKVRIRNQWVVLEKLRKQYNRRIKMATGGGDKKEQKQTIRYFKNPESKMSTKPEHDNNEKETHIDDNDEINNEKTEDTQNIDSENRKNVNDDDEIGKDTGITNGDTNSEMIDLNDKVSENSNNVNDDDEIGKNRINDDKNNDLNDKINGNEENDKGINDDDEDDEPMDDIKDLDYKESDLESNGDEETNPNGKLTFHTHQCYICFKLFKTKAELKLHCKCHFDICNEKMLKKCPFCGYVTNSTITRHIRLVHDIHYDIRKNGRIKEKNTENGPKYVFEIDKDCDLEIIPSISNLNKIASMKIDDRQRESKKLFLGTTKLVKKGKDWIVEKKKVNIDSEYMLPEFTEQEYQSLKSLGENYLERIRSLSILAKKKGLKMLYPCEGCDKICLNMSALKLHSRKHEANPKQFKPKVWKNKILNGLNGQYRHVNKVTNKKKKKSGNVQNNNIAVTQKSKHKSHKVERIGKKEDDATETIANRFADPNPVKNNHKCDRELITFYQKNIKGADIEFWQFLKIFNKMGRENVNDFKDLESRYDFGNHNIKDNDTTVTENTTENTQENKVDNTLAKPKKTKVNKNKKAFTRAIMISKKEHLKRLEIKKQMRERLKNSQN